MYVSRIDRRAFLFRSGRWLLGGVTALGALTLLESCGGGGETDGGSSTAKNAIDAASEAADPCNDLSDLTEADVTTRRTFKYQNPAADPTKICNTCNFFQRPPAGSLCGTCTIVKGPIHPLAGCISWAEKVKT